MKDELDYDPEPRSVLFILVKVLSLLAIMCLIIHKVQSIPSNQVDFDSSSSPFYSEASGYIDRVEMENALLAIGTTFTFIIHVIGLLAVIREHHWLLFIYSTYLSLTVLFNVLPVLQSPPLMVNMAVNLATGLLTFALALMSRNRFLLPFLSAEESI